MSYSREYLRESAEIYQASTFFRRLKCVMSLVLHFASLDRRYGALRIVAIETLIREFD